MKSRIDNEISNPSGEDAPRRRSELVDIDNKKK